MKLLTCFCIFILNLISFKSANQLPNEYELGSTVFENAIKDNKNNFIGIYGHRIKCTFAYKPNLFNEYEKIICDTKFSNQLANSSLIFKKEHDDGEIIMEEKVQSKLTKVIINGTAIDTFSYYGSIEIDSSKLDLTSKYSCCLGKNLENDHDSKCSILNFQNPSIDLNARFSWLAEKDFKLFDSKISSLEKLVIICGIIFLVLIVLAFSLAFYLSLRQYPKKPNLVIPINHPSRNLFNISQPLNVQNLQMTNQQSIKCDLYTHFNLVDETEVCNKIEIDCNEFPPTYDELAKKDLKKSNYDEDQRF
ncbi:unnamed protein product [Brachionus calyciflorus]|uniref:Uncharacterized protein n=1 Tax=Brachionus calyciflorus TaxID=104777 RepID=A0A814P0W9_9BILA|nr:unnamed protein product [Brachionus calyciflorus]